MRRTSSGFALVSLGCFAACAGAGNAERPDNVGAAAGHAGALGGAMAGAGSGGAAGSSSTDAGRGGTAGRAQGGAAFAGASGSAAVAGGGVGGTGGAGLDTGGAGGAVSEPVGLSWPVDCVPGSTCVNLGYPDTDDDGQAHDCGEPGYQGHEGTDIGITFAARDAGTAVRAAADGVVLFSFDGKYDQCPNASEPDCQDPGGYEPSAMTGTTVCTPVGPYCGTGEPGCFWCFAGGNVIVIRHEGVPGVFATRYDHLKKSSVKVKPGDAVTRGQKIAEAASAGNSSGPHLHFEVWGTGFYELADPWAGPCGPNQGPSLWAFDPPWSG